jgi:hypothetical protein
MKSNTGFSGGGNALSRSNLEFFEHSSFQGVTSAADRHSRRLESLESEHRPDSLLYPAMIMIDHVVQILAGSHPYPAWQRSNLFQFGDRTMRGGVAVQGDHLWDAMLPRRPGKVHRDSLLRTHSGQYWHLQLLSAHLISFSPAVHKKTSARSGLNLRSFRFFLVLFAVGVYSSWLTNGSDRLFLELTEAKWSP